MSQVYVNHLSDEARSTSITLLNALLADAIDLQLAAKQAHWTIKGSSFIGLHELLDDITGRLRDHSDMIAERCVILGGQPSGTAQAVSGKSRLPEYSTDITDQDDHVRHMTERLITFGGHLRDAIAKSDEAGDIDTSDLFTEISRAVDKDAWFVGAHRGS